MSYTDLLTIAMPCYERKDFFREALESALNQTVKCKIIVIDNCSSHNYYEEVCKEKNVTYYRNERNIGMSGNFSRSFELSDTKYVVNLQDDDKLHPQYVESFLNAVNQHPDIDIFFPDFELNTSFGRKPHHHTLPFGYMKNGKKIIEYGVKYKMGFPYIASAIKRSKIHSAKDVSAMIGSYDWEWLYSKADELIFFGDPRKLYLFRVHPNQDTYVGAPIYQLSAPYIYEMVLKEKVTDTKLKKKASRNAFWALVRLKSIADKNILKEYINGDSKYSHYLKLKLERNKLIHTVFNMPQWSIKLMDQSMKKMGIDIDT